MEDPENVKDKLTPHLLCTDWLVSVLLVTNGNNHH